MIDTILDFLKQLVNAQDATISVLQRKQKLLVKPNQGGLEAIAGEEKSVLQKLEEIQQRREEILTQGRKQGIEAESLQELCEKMLPNHFDCQRLIVSAGQRSRQIRYIALSNWSMTQRSMIHLAQMLEIIETKGQGKTTYGGPQNTSRDKPSAPGGGFVDRVA